jgi:hypothetical protein
MAIEKKDFKPGDVSTNIVRGSISSHKIANTILKSTKELQLNSSINRTEENPFVKKDSFGIKNEDNKNILDKQSLKEQIKENNIKQMTMQQHQIANNKAQAVLIYLFREVFPEGLKFFNRPAQIADSAEQARNISQEDFCRIIEEPMKILRVLQELIPARLSELKKKSHESGNLDEVAHYERVDEILSKIFDVTNQINGNGSHMALLSLLEELDQSKIQGELKSLIAEYHKSLNELGKNIQRANAQLINRIRHPYSELTTGVKTRIDQGLRDSLYTRPENLGAAQRDHYGGIMGKVYDYRDIDWPFGGTPWEYGTNIKGDSNNPNPPFPVRRLAGEMRGYIGTLTEDQPGPMFVTTDVEAKSPIKNKKRKNYYESDSESSEFDEDFDDEED